MFAAWPDQVERVSSFLREAGVDARIQEFPDGTPTAADAAEAAGCGLDQIVKSLVLLCDGRPVVALVPGDERGDTAKIGRAVEASTVRVAKPGEVEEATGFAPGAVAPFPLPKVSAVLMERELLQHHIVWAGAGSTRHILGIAPHDLMRLARARAMNLVADQPNDSSAQKES